MKKRNVRFTTKMGTAQWPHLNKPDTKFDKDGAYKVSLLMSKEDAEPLTVAMRSTLEDFMQSTRTLSSKKIAPLPVKDVTDDAGNPTGEVEIKFKLRAVGGSGNDRWEQRPLLIDAQRNPITEVVGGGSKIIVGAELIPYSSPTVGNGIALRLKAVQVIKLVEMTRGDGVDSWQFSQQDGFVTNGEPKEADSPPPPASGEESEEGFDW